MAELLQQMQNQLQELKEREASLKNHPLIKSALYQIMQEQGN